MAKKCTDCRHYFFDEEYSDHHLLASWCECSARPNVANLKQFPFQKTECAKFESASD